MRILFGCKVPDAARVVEVKVNPGGAGRPRTIYRGPLEEAGSYTLTEDAVIDAICADVRFWEWVAVQVRSGRIQSPGVGDTGFVRMRVVVSFLNQDGSLAVIDEGTGTTSYSCPDTWEFHKSNTIAKDTDPMTLVVELTKALMEQQKLLPDMMVRMLKEISENGKASIQTSAAESAKILAAMLEPFKSQLAIIDKQHLHETSRADKATDAVIRMLNSTDRDKGISEPEKLFNAGSAFLSMIEKSKKLLN